MKRERLQWSAIICNKELLYSGHVAVTHALWLQVQILKMASNLETVQNQLKEELEKFQDIQKSNAYYTFTSL